MNKFVKGKKFTILWHVKDLNMLHVDSDVVSRVLASTHEEYGKMAKMTITQGKIHKYLRMTIDYSYPGKVKLSMVDYSGNIL